jgi:hypothetical protein
VQESFINEFRNVLMERLLQKSAAGDYDTTQDEQTVELLKLRFGETSMVSCEIMVSARVPLASLLGFYFHTHPNALFSISAATRHAGL